MRKGFDDWRIVVYWIELFPKVLGRWVVLLTNFQTLGLLWFGLLLHLWDDIFIRPVADDFVYIFSF